MQYPLHLRFKLFALSPQIRVTDADNKTVCYVKQKLFRLKEAVNVYRDESREKILCEIKADRIIDFSANYNFYDESGETFGSVKRKGMRSIWKAHYEVYDDQQQHTATIQEENPMAKVMDSFLGEIPLVSLFSGYMFHPKYGLTPNGGDSPVMRVTKQPSMWEGVFKIDKLGEMDPVEELRGLMAFLMMLLLERSRG